MLAPGKKSLVGTIVAAVYFVFAVLDLWGWFTYRGQIVALTARDSVGVWVTGWMLRVLAMTPTPGILFWVRFAASRWLHGPVLQFGAGGFAYHLFVAGLAIALGFGLLRGRSWARWGVACLCLLAGAVNLMLLARALHAWQVGSVTGVIGVFRHTTPPVLGIAIDGILFFFFLRGEWSSTATKTTLHHD